MDNAKVLHAPVQSEQSCGCCDAPTESLLTSRSQAKSSEDAARDAMRLRVRVITLALAGSLFGIGFLAQGWVQNAVFLTAYLLVGQGVLRTAARNLVRGRMLDEHALMSIATLGAILLGELPEAVAVMLFYAAGEFLQDRAVTRSRRSIASLLDARPGTANLNVDGGLVTVSPEHVHVGDTIVVRPGEKVPLDGEVIAGESFVDTAALTGESVPRRVEPGSYVLAGMVATHGLLTVRVTRAFADSSIAKILDLVQNAASRKAPTERFITRVARIYTPAVVLAATLVAILPPLIIPGATFETWIYRALVLLVISCPCALVISIPLGYFGGIGASSRSGILVKGANYLDALTQLDTVVFDKTGTLTEGVFDVTHIVPAEGYSEYELLRLAAIAEMHSNHPIAESIRKAYDRPLDTGQELESYEEFAGHGVAVRWNGRDLLAGNERFLTREGVAVPQLHAHGTVVHVAVDAVYAGHLVISDKVKEDASEALRAMRNLGVRNLVMLTGDSRRVAAEVADQLGLDEWHAELLPEDKLKKLEELQRSGREGKLRTACVGDGINDAPMLTRADVGIAMGGLGSDAAIEAADVVLMNDRPTGLVNAIRIARATRRVVIQNIAFALGVKAIFIVLGTLGVATIWEAIFADVGVTLLAVLNAMRTLKLARS